MGAGYSGLLVRPVHGAGVGQSGVELVCVTGDQNLLFVDVDHESKELPQRRQLVGYNDQVLQLKYMPSFTPSLPPGDGAQAAEAGQTGPRAAGRRVAVATNSPEVRVMSVDDMSSQLLPGHTDIVLTLSVSPNG